MGLQRVSSSDSLEKYNPPTAMKAETEKEFYEVAEECQKALETLQKEPTSKAMSLFKEGGDALQNHFDKKYEFNPPRISNSCSSQFRHWRVLARLLNQYHAIPKESSVFCSASILTSRQVKELLHKQGYCVEENPCSFVISRICKVFSAKERSPWDPVDPKTIGRSKPNGLGARYCATTTNTNSAFFLQDSLLQANRAAGCQRRTDPIFSRNPFNVYH